MFYFQVLNNGFNHQIRVFHHTTHIGRSVQSCQDVGNKFILLVAIVFELLLCNATQTRFDAILCLFYLLIVDLNDCDIVASCGRNLIQNRFWTIAESMKWGEKITADRKENILVQCPSPLNRHRSPSHA